MRKDIELSRNVSSSSKISQIQYDSATTPSGVKLYIFLIQSEFYYDVAETACDDVFGLKETGCQLTTLYSDDELNLIYQEEDHICENLSIKKSWVKVSNLVVPGVTDKEMVLIHLLWFQSIKRVVIYDADPLSGAVLISLNFDQIKKEPRKS